MLPQMVNKFPLFYGGRSVTYVQEPVSYSFSEPCEIVSVTTFNTLTQPHSSASFPIYYLSTVLSLDAIEV